MESQAEYGRRLMDEINREDSEKAGITRVLFWEGVKKGLERDELGFYRLYVDCHGMKAAEKQDVTHRFDEPLIEIVRKLRAEREKK